MAPRREVLWFATEMERQLARNDHKSGWSECSCLWLMRRLKDETSELRRALDRDDDSLKAIQAVIAEAADVANFAMMIADNYRARALASPLEEPR